MEASSAAGYAVTANVTVPISFASSPPSGGLRLRIRAPIEHAGQLNAVSVGGKVWTSFDAAAETVDFSAAQLTAEMVKDGLPSITVKFA